MASGSKTNSDDDIGIAARILNDLFKYLRTNLPIGNNLASELFGWKPSLLGSQEHKRIRALNGEGKDDDAFQTWFSFATEGYTEVSLVELCKCLRRAGKDARPKLIDIAVKIETAMKSCRSGRSASTQEKKMAVPDLVIKSTTDLLPYLDQLKTQLKLLGSALGIQSETAAIEKTSEDPTTKCLQVLEYWLKVTANPSWSSLCTKLKVSESFNNVRELIEKDHFQ